MTCPVLTSCYTQLQKYYYPTGGSMSQTAAFLSYDDSLPDWEELDEAIQRDLPSESTQRLRGFYALELAYAVIIPSGPYVEKVDLSAISAEHKRDEEGLGELIQACEALKKQLTMRRGHAELLGRETNPALELLTATYRSTGARVDTCIAMAHAMQLALKGNDKELSTVGRLLGGLMVSCKTDIGISIQKLQEMLSVSLDNPVKPWTQSNRFQV